MNTGEHQKCLNVESDFGFGVHAFQMNGNPTPLILNILQYSSKNALADHTPSVCCSDYSRTKRHETKSHNYLTYRF